MVRFDPRLVQYDAAQTQQFYKQLAERVRTTPGVVSAALTQNPPLGLGEFDRLGLRAGGFRDAARPRELHFDDGHRRRGVLRDDGDTDPARPRLPCRPTPRTRRGSRSSTSSSRSTTGRAPTPSASASGSRPRRHAGRDRRGRADHQVPRQPAEKPMDFVYLPLAQHRSPRMILLLRSSGDPAQLVKPVKDVVRALDPNMPLLETRTYEDLYRYSVDGPRVADRAGRHDGRGGPAAGDRRASTGWWPTT